MSTKLKMGSVFAHLRAGEWGKGVLQHSLRNPSQSRFAGSGEGHFQAGGCAVSPTGDAGPRDPVRMLARRAYKCGFVGCVALAAGLSLSATPALAARTLESQITGVAGSQGIVVDASGNIWTVANHELKEFAPSPSHTQLTSVQLQGGTKYYSLAIRDETGEIYAFNHNGGDLDVFDSNGHLEHEFGKEGAEAGGFPLGTVDNTQGPSGGRLYAVRNNYTTVVSLDSQLHPRPFPATAPYVDGNTLTGTPAGPFENISDVNVDAQGNLYVVDRGNRRVDEFDSTGTFLRAFTDAGVPEGFTEVTKEENYNGNGFSFHGGLVGVAVDPSNGNVLIVDQGHRGSGSESFYPIDEFDASGNFLQQIHDPRNPGVSCGNEGEDELYGSPGLDAEGHLYVGQGCMYEAIDIFSPATPVPKVSYKSISNPTATSGTLRAEVDPNGAGDISECEFEYVEAAKYESEAADPYGEGQSAACSPDPSGSHFSSPVEVQGDISGLTPEATYHYRAVVRNVSGGLKYGSDQTYTPHRVIGLRTEEASALGESGATLDASFLGNGEETHYFFEWGVTNAYGNKTPESTSSPASNVPQQLSAALGELSPYTTYHYRVVATNGAGISFGEDRYFTTFPERPKVDSEFVSSVHASTATLGAQIDPQGFDTTYHLEYVDDATFQADVAQNGPGHGFDHAHSEPVPDADAGTAPLEVSVQLDGLEPGVTYDYRFIARSAFGTREGPERTFTTFPFRKEVKDSCPNSHVRQQTGAALLLDCRAYELVSAPNTAGYDVESSLIEGQTPYGGYPEADGRVLYGVHDGGIPGAGEPTNRGVDPYLAVRGESEWRTSYVGIPANDPFSSEPFSSVPSGASADLGTFAFGGTGGCSPCLEGEYTGIPVRLPSGELVQGMVPGPGIEPGSEAEPGGYVAKDLSANGSHFVFASTTRFAEGGNESTGDVSIYDHNLKTGETHVVSNTQETEDFPQPLPCIQGSGKCSAATKDANGIAELDISADGSHILLGQKVSEDADHNVYWHLYMDVDDSIRSIDLTPGIIAKPGGAGFKEGVLFDGMNADGSKVFFTTADKLLSEDTDSSADVYEAEVGEGSAELKLISTGAAGPSNSDSCNPVANSGSPHWNTVGSAANCDAVAIGGGGGVAAESGSIYFLSPELLGGASSGTANQPNLYLAAPGSSPRFIATLEPNNTLVLDAMKEVGTRHTADFQVTSNGDFAAFPSTLALAGHEEETAGHTALFRYDANTEAIECVSCAPTGARAEGDASLASVGLSLTEDGRVFFNTPDQLAAADTDAIQDVYEWEPQGSGTCQSESAGFDKATGACIELISAGTSSFDSGLLSVSTNGTDAYFFTRDSLAPQDKNGSTVKIYDAREGGGFPYTLPEKQCQASDECHGAGSAGPGPLQVGSLAGAEINAEPEKSCTKDFVLKRGHCVKKPKPQKHKHHKNKKSKRRRGGNK